MKKSINWIVMNILLFLPLLVYAANSSNYNPGIGGVAQHMMEPLGFFADFVDTICFVLGGSFVFASIIRFIEHRRNPLMVTMSTVVFLFIAGIILILLPFLALVTEHGIPHSLMRKV